MSASDWVENDPLAVISRHCQRAKIEPFESLVYLLRVLQRSSVMHSVKGFVGGANNEASVLQEIQGWMQLLQQSTGQSPQPSSLLAVLDMALQSQQVVDSLNLQQLRSINEPSEGQRIETDNLDRSFRAGQVFRAILKDLMNFAEKNGLSARIVLEEMARKEGWKLFGQEDPPQPPPEEKDRNE